MLGTGALRRHAGSDVFHFDMELRVESSPPCEPAHILLTALARFAQRSGFYARSLDALALSVDDSISSSMLYGTCISMPSIA